MNILQNISIDPIIITFLLLICILVKILNTISSQIHRNNNLMVEILKSNKENNQTEINFTDEENLKLIQNNKYFKEQNKKLNQLQISLNKISGDKKVQNVCYSTLKSNFNDILNKKFEILNKKFENLSKILNELKISTLTKKQRFNLSKTLAKIDKTLHNTEFMGLYGEPLTGINDKLNTLIKTHSKNTKSTDKTMLLSILNKKKINEQFKENQLVFDAEINILKNTLSKSDELQHKNNKKINKSLNTIIGKINSLLKCINKNYESLKQINISKSNNFSTSILQKLQSDQKLHMNGILTQINKLAPDNIDRLNSKIDTIIEISSKNNGNNIEDAIGLIDKINQLNNIILIGENTRNTYLEQLHENTEKFKEILDILINDEYNLDTLKEKIIKCLLKDKNQLIIVSSDAINFKLNKDVAALSELIKLLHEGDRTNDIINIPKLSSKILEIIIDYMEYKYKNPNNKIMQKNEICEWESAFMKKIHENDIFLVSYASTYLGIESLFELICKFIKINELNFPTENNLIGNKCQMIEELKTGEISSNAKDVNIKASIVSEELESKLTNRNLLVNTLLNEIINIFYERIYDYDMNKDYFRRHQFNDYFQNTFINPLLANKYTFINNLLNQFIKNVNMFEGDDYQLKNKANCLLFEFEFIDYPFYDKIESIKLDPITRVTHVCDVLLENSKNCNDDNNENNTI